MRKYILAVFILLFLLGCGSNQKNIDNTPSFGRTLKICTYNFLVGWMSSGSSSSVSSIDGDVKKAIDAYSTTRYFGNICEENKSTINESF